jgi:hypothetical protein
MGRALDLVGHRNREILEGNPAFSVFGGQKLVGPEPELADPLASTNRAEGDRKVLRRSRKAPPFSASALYRAGKSGVVTSRTRGATSRFEGGGGGAARHDAQRKALAA